MINGLYSGANALDYSSRQQELVSSNLAHLNTPGHKRIQFMYHENDQTKGQSDSTEPPDEARLMAVDFSQGRLETTERPLDLAINGDGFFVYQGAEGEVYSRNGVVFRDPEGVLRNGDGLPLLGDGQPVTIPPEVTNRSLVIDGSGSISVRGSEIGRISMVKFDDNQRLESESQIYFRAGQAVASPAEGATVIQGARELSNAHPVTELISLIVSSRQFETAQKVIRSISETIQASIRA